MSDSRLSISALVLGRLILSFVLVVSRIAHANAQEAKETESPGGQEEGIKVHGHWTIDVRNRDGKLVTHREFENSLQDGRYILGPLLGRANTAGNWLVFVFGPCPVVLNLNYCIVAESTETYYQGSGVFNTLTVNAPVSPNAGAGTVTLSGTFTAQIAAQISDLRTGLETCAPTVAPASCPALATNLGFYFSHATIAPIAVTVGQLVQVTVVYSFS